MSNCGECDCGLGILEQFPDKAGALEQVLSAQPVTADIEKNRGMLIECLHKAQGIFGYLPEDIQTAVAKRLRLTQADVYGVISFYAFFIIEPPGKHRISVCSGTACFVKGADRILEEFERQLDIKNGETREDGLFSLGALRCVGACSLAPVVMVDDRIYGHMTPAKVTKILQDHE